MEPKYKKKLIEVALPLAAINEEGSRRKRKAPKGYPTLIHWWQAQRPVAACRAVLFAQLVDDPSGHPDRFRTETEQDAERQRLFGIVEDLVKWENTTNERVIEMAREEIRNSTNDDPPAVLDPFCGSGAIPLEAQRLGLESHGHDLNPIAVLITKALIEIPSKFANRPPVNPTSRQKIGGDVNWRGAQGLAEDVLHYGRWIRDEALKRIGHLYPTVSLPAEHGNGKATVVAWLWARTVKCPNPACGAQIPMVRSFQLSGTKGKEIWIEPIVDRQAKTVQFAIRRGVAGVKGTKWKRGARCLLCPTDGIKDSTLRSQSVSNGIGRQLLAVVAQGRHGRIYLPATPEVSELEPPDILSLEQLLPENARWFSPPLYGLKRYRDLFTSRQIVSLKTVSDLVDEVRGQVYNDAISITDPALEHEDAREYADGVATYLGFVVSRLADYNSTIATWRTKDNAMRSSIPRQAIQMTWDYAEANPFGDSSAGIQKCTSVVASTLDFLPFDVYSMAHSTAEQHDASSGEFLRRNLTFCTDPPYYDNIGYADISEYFYLWLRLSLGRTYPRLLATVTTPKHGELVASPYRHGGKDEANRFFERGMRRALSAVRKAATPDLPITIFYAFKQAEGSADGVVSTGWESFLTAVIEAGFQVVSTLPMRTEGDNRQNSVGTNALASSVVLACRPRSVDSPLATRREFLSALRSELPDALRLLKKGSIAPVDLAQAAIGPGMAVFSRYSKILDGDSMMPVGRALALINQVLDETLAEQEGEFDADTRWALTWFEQHGFGDGKYDDAEILSKAKNTSVSGMEAAGIIKAGASKVRILRRGELPSDWDPRVDPRFTVWEATQQLIRAHEGGGEDAAAALLGKLGSVGEAARDLAYRLYSICERKKWAQEALPFNALVVAWPEIVKRSRELPTQPVQKGLEYS